MTNLPSTQDCHSGPHGIDDICEAFEIAFGHEPRPVIEHWLHGEGPQRLQLLLGLVRSELELRLRKGEPARLSEYLTRFPELIHFPNELAVILQVEVELRR
jgi:hypothetical protein